MSMRRRVLVHLIRDILKEAAPSVAGRVFNQVSVPANAKDVPCILVNRGNEPVSGHDAAPLSYKRTLSIEITAIAKGNSREAEDAVTFIIDEIEDAMRELQFVVASDSDALLIDEIHQVNVTGTQPFKEGERAYVGSLLTYEATYVTDEGSRGDAGPGVPARNVLAAFHKAVTTWQPVATDQISFQEKET